MIKMTISHLKKEPIIALVLLLLLWFLARAWTDLLFWGIQKMLGRPLDRLDIFLIASFATVVFLSLFMYEFYG
jgi:hypothetical protein